MSLITDIHKAVIESTKLSRNIKTIMLTESEIIQLRDELIVACPLNCNVPTVQDLLSGECKVMGMRVIERETTLKFKL